LLLFLIQIDIEMKVYREDSEIINAKNAVVTVGSFDGLHIGHFKILDKVKECAAQNNGSSVVVTFEPHPRSVVSQNFDLKILTTLDEKIEILEKAEIENLVVIDFTKEYSQLTSEEFIKQCIVEKIGASHMVIGHDHKFGKDRLGDVDKLKEIGSKYKFNVSAVTPLSVDGEIVSSTAIRSALVEGNIEKADSFLGRNYLLNGKVVIGAQRGRLLGFPTANILPDDAKKAVPVNGVYFTACEFENEKHYGIMNIGYRPTFERKHELVLEVHILNFNRDIYGKQFKVSFLKRLREEKKFESKDALIHQMELDKRIASEMVAVQQKIFL
jgi:riboflavin kinase / FMN adenylyltransferase